MSAPKKSVPYELHPSLKEAIRRSVGEEFCMAFVPTYAHDLERVLVVKHYHGELVFPHEMGSVESLYIDSCHRIASFQYFGTLKYLCLDRFTGIIDLYHLKTIEFLEFKSCPELVDLSGLRGGSFEKVKIEDCDVVDLSPLSGCNNVTIAHCREIATLKGLTNVDTVSLEYCDRLVDISALGRDTKKISILGCQDITDVTALRDGPTYIYIYANDGITDISSLAGGTIRTLHIDGCGAHDVGELFEDIDYSYSD